MNTSDQNSALPRMKTRILAYIAGYSLVLILTVSVPITVMALIGGYRMEAMAIGMLMAPFLGWITVPFLISRTFNWLKLMWSSVCVFVGCLMGVTMLTLNIGVSVQLGGPYGIFDAVLASVMPAIILECLYRYRPQVLLTGAQ